MLRLINSIEYIEVQLFEKYSDHQFVELFSIIKGLSVDENNVPGTQATWDQAH